MLGLASLVLQEGLDKNALSGELGLSLLAQLIHLELVQQVALGRGLRCKESMLFALHGGVQDFFTVL